jgi:hypothetical protein
MTQWRLDDEAVAYPMYDLSCAMARNARSTRFFNICIHGGCRLTQPRRKRRSAILPTSRRRPLA